MDTDATDSDTMDTEATYTDATDTGSSGRKETPRRGAMTPGALRVLEAAGRLFYERGIHAVGVDLIAAEAGVTKKTLYDRFGSKDRIVVAYLTDRDERWRAHLAERLAHVAPGSADRVLAVFDASRSWMAGHGARGCSMINAHAEISDTAHPAYAVIAGQKQWMLTFFTDLVAPFAPDRAGQTARALMLLHEGALVAHGLRTFPDPIGTARDRARDLLAGLDAPFDAPLGAGPDEAPLTPPAARS